MHTFRCIALAALTGAGGHAIATDDPERNRAFQDHIAYVATFAIPVLSEKCAVIDPDYIKTVAPLYFRFVNERQDQIERGRLLTLSELAADDTLQSYRSRVISSRLGALDSGTAEQKSRMCKGALAMLSGMTLPGEWPSRDDRPERNAAVK
jgi:hypothetical protein